MNTKENYHVQRAQELGLPEGTGKRYSASDIEAFLKRSEENFPPQTSENTQVVKVPTKKGPKMPVRRGDLSMQGFGLSYEIDSTYTEYDDDDISELDELLRIRLKFAVPKFIEIAKNLPKQKKLEDSSSSSPEILTAPVTHDVFSSAPEIKPSDQLVPLSNQASEPYNKENQGLKQESTVGAFLRALRQKAGLSQDKLFINSGISPTYISMFENNKLRYLTEHRIKTLARALGLDQAETEKLVDVYKSQLSQSH